MRALRKEGDGKGREGKGEQRRWVRERDGEADEECNGREEERGRGERKEDEVDNGRGENVANFF